MKKILSSVIASLMLMSFVLSGCSQLSDGESKTSSSSAAQFGKYSEFGASVKSGFEEKFGDAEEARSALLSEPSVAESDENSDENVEYLDEDVSSAEYLLENNYISETAAAYIKRIASAIDNAGSKASFNEEVSAIETEAMENLSDSDLDSVMYYAEASKASADYWAEDDAEARWSLRKFCRKYRHVIISSGLGAVAGAVIGTVISKANPTAIAISAATGAIVSGYSAYKSGKTNITYSKK